MSEAHDRQHAPKYAWCKAIPHVMQTATLLHVQDRQGACSHGNSSRETLQCKHRGGREVCITSELLVDDTFTSRSGDCAAVAAALQLPLLLLLLLSR